MSKLVVHLCVSFDTNQRKSTPFFRGPIFLTPQKRTLLNFDSAGSREAQVCQSNDFHLLIDFLYLFILIFMSTVNVTAKDAWCTDKENKDQYIQVDFLLKTRVSLVGTMRRKSKDHWVTKYFLQYSDDDVTWIDYLENGHVKVRHTFSG